MAGTVDTRVADGPDGTALLERSDCIEVGLHELRLVTFVRSAAIDVVRHNVRHHIEGIVLIEVVEPLQWVVSRHKTLEHTLFVDIVLALRL